jgi:pimeloyl-ACP methyl ester carboxylesterase
MVRRSGLAVAAALLIASCATAPLRDAGASTRIEEAGFITLGGIEQWVTIRGDDDENPVLLVVHGGPGDVLSPYVEEFAPYEADFIVVQWDQRGSGRTYGRLKDATPDLTLERVAQDGVELADHLTQRLGQEKVMVFGHSWGSVVAVEMVKLRPELFSAYVGTGQVASWAQGVQAQFDYLVERAETTGDEEWAADLTAIGTPDPMNPQQYFTFTRPLRSHLNPSDTAWLGNLLARAEEVSTPEEFADASAGMDFSGRALFPAIMAEDLFTTASRLDVPVTVIQGSDDWFTPTAPAVAWFEQLDAPTKQIFVLGGAGHFALVTHQKQVVAALTAAEPNPATAR